MLLRTLLPPGRSFTPRFLSIGLLLLWIPLGAITFGFAASPSFSRVNDLGGNACGWVPVRWVLSCRMRLGFCGTSIVIGRAGCHVFRR